MVSSKGVPVAPGVPSTTERLHAQALALLERHGVLNVAPGVEVS